MASRRTCHVSSRSKAAERNTNNVATSVASSATTASGRPARRSVADVAVMSRSLARPDGTGLSSG
jgi:hypothetical protein